MGVTYSGTSSSASPIRCPGPGWGGHCSSQPGLQGRLNDALGYRFPAFPLPHKKNALEIGALIIALINTEVALFSIKTVAPHSRALKAVLGLRIYSIFFNEQNSRSFATMLGCYF